MITHSSFPTAFSPLLCEDRNSTIDDSSSWWQVLGALTVLSSLVTIPLAQYRPLYAITVGYGASVAFIALFVWSQCTPLATIEETTTGNIVVDQLKSFLTSPEQVLVTSAVFYGLRLAMLLLLRDIAGWKPRDEMSQNVNRLARVPFAVSLSLLYACLTCPIVFMLRNPPTPGTWQYGVAMIGSYGAWIAAKLEALADLHKSWCKHRAPSNQVEDKKGTAATFVGPTRGLYGITRHPNYSAEVLYWTCVWLCGITSFGNNNWGAWIASTLGWLTIVSIMDTSTKRLEDYQSDSYQDQPMYKEWIQRVPYPLIPGIQSTSILELLGLSSKAIK